MHERGDRPGRHTRRLTVLIDARMARRRRTGGARYITGLIAALPAHAPDITLRVVHGPPGLPRRNHLTSIGNLVLDLAWTHLALPVLALRHRADVLHAPFNWGPVLSPCPMVATIHDLSWEVMPDAYPAAFRRYAALFTRLTARRARRILAISGATRDDLHRHYGIPLERVGVAYIGITPHVAPDAPGDDAGGPSAPFVLSVGEFEPRKRVPELVAAHRAYLRDAPEDPPPCRLVLAGAGGADEPVVRGEHDGSCEMVGFVSDDELARLYHRATLLVNNSAFEGFGLPVAEAAAAGCPVLVADTPALREAGGPEALVVDGDGPDALAAALGAALADREGLRRRGERAREHAARFSWQACAASTVAAYRQAAGVAV